MKVIFRRKTKKIALKKSLGASTSCGHYLAIAGNRQICPAILIFEVQFFTSGYYGVPEMDET